MITFILLHRTRNDMGTQVSSVSNNSSQFESGVMCFLRTKGVVSKFSFPEGYRTKRIKGSYWHGILIQFIELIMMMEYNNKNFCCFFYRIYIRCDWNVWVCIHIQRISTTPSCNVSRHDPNCRSTQEKMCKINATVSQY